MEYAWRHHHGLPARVDPGRAARRAPPRRRPAARPATATPGRGTRSSSSAPRRAAPAFLGDAAKGLAAGLVGLRARRLVGRLRRRWRRRWSATRSPVFADFRGGKAVMTFVGGAFALSPLAARVALALCGAVDRSPTRRSSWAPAPASSRSRSSSSRSTRSSTCVATGRARWHHRGAVRSRRVGPARATPAAAAGPPA